MTLKLLEDKIHDLHDGKLTITTEILFAGMQFS